jgi:uncharacterized membrane protein YbhN (UPF0104 family)
MSNDRPTLHGPLGGTPAPAAAVPSGSRFSSDLVRAWFWFLTKNLIGWALIVGSVPLGMFIPGPGGIPLFLIGLALVTLPGKRHATARVLRGIPVDPRGAAYRLSVFGAALLLPAAALAYAAWKWESVRDATNRLAGWTFAGYLAAALVIGLAGAFGGGVVNRLIAAVPRARRQIRPWMRDRGIQLLPPRRRRRYVEAPPAQFESMDDTILQFAPRHVTRMQAWWQVARRWLKRAFGVVVTVAIFVWILKPIVTRWDQVRDRVWAMNWGRVVAASVLFAVFLFVFRALVWRRLLKNFGHKLPVWTTTRIWSTSELARYLPGAVWQVVGRVYLTKPYGIRGSVVSTSQVMELALFLLANLIVALGALTFLGWKSFDGTARLWLVVSAVLIPVLSMGLHPKVFYPVADRILVKLKKPPIQKRMRWKSLFDLLLWNIVGLGVQGLAIYLVVFELLDLKLAKWWVVTGAYCLAWCAGFLAFWAPGGLGVREVVFIAAMNFAIPLAVRSGSLQDPQQRELFLIFLSVLLRIWATLGELILAAAAYAVDWKGRTADRAQLRLAHAAAAVPRGDAGTTAGPTAGDAGALVRLLARTAFCRVGVHPIAPSSNGRECGSRDTILMPTLGPTTDVHVRLTRPALGAGAVG